MNAGYVILFFNISKYVADLPLTRLKKLPSKSTPSEPLIAERQTIYVLYLPSAIFYSSYATVKTLIVRGLAMSKQITNPETGVVLPERLTRKCLT
jgi:hypothetical protein